MQRSREFYSLAWLYISIIESGGILLIYPWYEACVYQDSDFDRQSSYFGHFPLNGQNSGSSGLIVWLILWSLDDNFFLDKFDPKTRPTFIQHTYEGTSCDGPSPLPPRWSILTRDRRLHSLSKKPWDSKLIEKQLQPLSSRNCGQCQWVRVSNQRRHLDKNLMFW